MDEFELIDRLVRLFDESGASLPDGVLVVPNGDDAAVVRPSSGLSTLTTDALVDGVHFALDLCSLQDAGFRSIAVNLSDLAAMGATPTGLLVSLILPPSLADCDVLEIGRGIACASARFDVPVIGGNITRTSGPTVISITACGDQRGPCGPRSGARIGDGLWVSGHPGDGAIGLRLLQSHPLIAERFPRLVSAWRRPQPRLDLIPLFHRGLVDAAIDISDGLLADLGHICKASGILAAVDKGAIPVSQDAIQAARMAGIPDLDRLVLTGGDDYQLLIAAPPSSEPFMIDAGLARIGTFEPGAGVEIIESGVRNRFVGNRGWLHRQDRDS